MAIKQAFTPFFLTLITIPHTIEAMETAVATVRQEAATTTDGTVAAEPKVKAALEPWPSSFYEEVFTGYRAIRSAQSLQTFKATATAYHKNPEAAASLSHEDKTLYGWVGALIFAEKTLFAKPYETWTLLDLQLLVGYLTRFTASKPGSLRTQEHRTGAKPTDKKEAKKFMKLLKAQRTLSAEEEAFLAERLTSYPAHKEVPELIGNALKETQTEMVQARATEDHKTRTAAIIAVAVKVHFQIVRISPFQDNAIDDTHLRLGRLVMTILLHQHGIERPIYTDRAYYNGKMLGCLKAGTEADLLTYTYELIQRREMSKELANSLESNPELDGWIRTLTAAGNGNRPLILNKKQAEQLLGLATQEKDICAGCQKQQKESSRKQCGRCKEVVYCSAECQKKHWPVHKANCLPAAPKTESE